MSGGFAPWGRFGGLADGGILTFASVGSTPANSAASVAGTVATLQPADATHAGLVSITTQSLAGAKTFTGDVALSANVGFSFPATLAPSGTTQTISWATGCSQTVDASSTTGTLVLTLTNPLLGGRYVLTTIGKTGRVWTFPASVKWASGVAPTVTATDGALDAFSLVWNGTIYFGSILAQNVS